MCKKVGRIIPYLSQPCLWDACGSMYHTQSNQSKEWTRVSYISYCNNFVIQHRFTRSRRNNVHRHYSTFMEDCQNGCFKRIKVMIKWNKTNDEIPIEAPLLSFVVTRSNDEPCRPVTVLELIMWCCCGQAIKRSIVSLIYQIYLISFMCLHCICIW